MATVSMSPDEEKTEVQRLDTILTRLALTRAENMPRVAPPILAPLLHALGTSNAAVRSKALEVLTHLNRRVKEDTAVLFPIPALLAELLYGAREGAPLVVHTALLYVEMAFERAPAEQRGAAIATILEVMVDTNGAKAESLAPVLKRLLARSASDFMTVAVSSKRGKFVKSPMDGTDEDRSGQKKLFELLKNDRHRAMLLACAKDVLLFEFPLTERTKKEKTNPLLLAAGLGTNAGGDTAMEDVSPSSQPPPLAGGLTREGMDWISGSKSPLTKDEMARIKLGMLYILGESEMETQDYLLHLIVASSDSRDSVRSRAEDLLRRPGSKKPDYEDSKTILALFSLFHGSVAGKMGAKVTAAPASNHLKEKIVQDIFLRSLKAANLFPVTLQTIYACIFSDGNARLRRLGVEYAVWTFRHATIAQLTPMAPLVMKGIIQLLDQTLPSVQLPNDTNNTHIRNFCYQAIALLAQGMPKLLASEVSLAERLFNEIANETGGTRSYIQEACGSLSAAFEGCKEDDANRLEELMLRSMRSRDDAVRLVAVSWARRLFPFSHAGSRFICMLATGDKRHDVVDEGKKGLEKPKLQHGEVDEDPYPTRGDVMLVLSRNINLEKTASLVPYIVNGSYVAMVSFIKRCSGVLNDELLSKYFIILQSGVESASIDSVSIASMEALIEFLASNSASSAGVLDFVEPISKYVSHKEESCRELAAKILGQLCSSMPAERIDGLLLSLLNPLDGGPVVGDTDMNGNDTKPLNPARESGLILAASCMVARLDLMGKPLNGALQSTVSKLIQLSITRLSSDEACLCSASAAAIGYLGLCGGSTRFSGDVIVKLVGKDEKEKTSPVVSISLLIAKLFQHSELRVARACILASSLFAWGCKDEEVSKALATKLFEVSTRKNEEVQSDVGRALGIIFSGPVQSTESVLDAPPDATRTQFSSTLIRETRDVEEIEAMEEKWLVDLQKYIIDTILESYIYSSTEQIRSAACCWLVTLVSMHGSHPQLQPRLLEIQESFSHLLGDSNEITQEIASYGVSMVYEVGGTEIREQLLKGLVATLSGQSKPKRAVKVDGDTRIFNEGTLGKAPGGGQLTTYKELCNLATELGNPDLMYRFMELANTKAAASSRRGAAFGFVRLARHAGEELKPYLDELLPKLFRMRHDPNPQVADAMDAIFTSLLDDPKKTVDQHIDKIICSALKDIGSRSWRVREASCSCLSEVLQGREWDTLGDHFGEMWEMCFRAMDDIKETVRISATRLAKSLRSATLRMCSQKLKSSSTIAKVVLPILLDKGVSSTVNEIVSISLHTMMAIVKESSSDTLRPVMSQLVVGLLESLTGLEDVRLNYIEQHAERIGGSEMTEKLENARAAAARSSPMSETLDRLVRNIDDEAVLEDLVPRLTGILRQGVGLNTRIGTARFVCSLAENCGPGGSLRPHAGPLLRACAHALRSESSPVVRKGLATAAGTIARYAPSGKVTKFADEILVPMNEENGDDRSRASSGLVFREMYRHASDATKALKQGDIIPVIYLAIHDNNVDVSKVWEEVWEEAVSVTSSAFDLYREEICERITNFLTSSQWWKKTQASKAIASLANADKGMSETLAHALAEHLAREVPGRVWDGKEIVFKAIGALCEEGRIKDDDELAGQINGALFQALSRKNKTFKRAALDCLVFVVQAFGKYDYLSQYQSILSEGMQSAQTEADKLVERTAMENKNKNEQTEDSKGCPLPVDECLKCLNCIMQQGPSNIGDDMLRRIAEDSIHLLGAQFPWTTRLGTLRLCATLYPIMAKSTICDVDLMIPVLECATENRYSKVRLAVLDVISAWKKLESEGKPHENLVLKVVKDLEEDKNSDVRSKARSCN